MSTNIRAWCIAWRTKRMTASAFWYFREEDEARAAFRKAAQSPDIERVCLKPCWVPETTRFMGEVVVLSTVNETASTVYE